MHHVVLLPRVFVPLLQRITLCNGRAKQTPGGRWVVYEKKKKIGRENVTVFFAAAALLLPMLPRAGCNYQQTAGLCRRRHRLHIVAGLFFSLEAGEEFSPNSRIFDRAEKLTVDTFLLTV